MNSTISVPDQASRLGSSLVDDLLIEIERMLVDGELNLGDKVPEQLIADRLGVGRAPVREALRTLEGRRILERTPNSGVRVVNLSVDDLDQLLVTREALEMMCCRLAAENMTLREIQGLRACLQESNKPPAAESPSTAFRRGSVNEDFHARIAMGSRNVWLAAYLTRDLYALLRLYRLKQKAVAERVAEARSEHLQIVEAIQRRDPDAAEALMREHVRHGRELLLQELQAAR
jgi:DNA-binding GntR family transcriptional regulator